jgi:hypothetical protein
MLPGKRATVLRTSPLELLQEDTNLLERQEKWHISDSQNQALLPTWRLALLKLSVKMMVDI